MAARDGKTPEELAALEFVPNLPALTGPQVTSIAALSDEALAEG